VDAWADIRLKARECHAAALRVSKGDRDGRAIVNAALEIDDLKLRKYKPGSTAGPGVFGFLERASRIVNVAEGQEPAEEVRVIAHEIGHYKSHRDPRNEVTLSAPGLGGDPIDSGAGRVEGYSPRERKEVQAEIFAGEFLCPSDWLREELLSGGKHPRAIAQELGIPPGLVINQAIRAVLLPPLQICEDKPTVGRHTLDPSQQTAAAWTGGPLLVDAGPGTGKTRTLVHRIGHALTHGASSGSILALTFSNKAAEEMRERLFHAHGDAAIEMWVGTFHAFGLELVTKWPDRLKRSARVRVLDQAESLALLEANLARLPLRYYQNLYEPAFELVHVLRAISRCKDELITPTEYRVCAAADLAAASNDEEREKAEKALEVAAIYEIYEDALEKADAVDFGDLVSLACRLMEENADVRGQLQSRFDHILVDEYQDVNRASARLLRVLCKDDAKLWVVADQRQSIYRFRGAEPSNVERFKSEFDGSRHSLTSNYRSGEKIVRVFESFSTAMKADGSMAGRWVADRGDVGEASLVVAPSLPSEGEAIRDRIEALRESGVAYADQVILARTHLTLARITGVLENLGVPLLYLGDLFERSEIRDLLSLVAIDAEFGSAGLVRVAQLSDYSASRNDALIVLRWARTNERTVVEALKQVQIMDGVTDAGRVGLARLGVELDGLGPATSPWTLLTTWLFERSTYLQPLLTANDAKSKQKLIAIYHLLKVCSEQAAAGNNSRKRFLERIRRIEALNEDTAYRAVASEAAGMDAVRVMTIHGSKGLEFEAVHFPALATRYMPSNRQGVRCPPPRSLPQLAMEIEDHDDEEACLFFVGLSRARDFLCLSRAEQYTSTTASASKFLGPIAAVVRRTRREEGSRTTSDEVRLTAPAPRAMYEERELATYMECPARYRYEMADGLRGFRDDSAYIQFHRCVYRTIGWLEEERQNHRACDVAAGQAHLMQEWQTRGPVGDAFETYYRGTAESMITAMTKSIAAETGAYQREEWLVRIGAKEIAVTPDRVLIGENQSVRVQRVRTGHKTKSEAENPIYALLRRGAALRYPGRAVAVETFYLATSEVVPVPPKNDGKYLQAYADVIAEIERGDFTATPNARRCPNCPCYFICGA
jgi:DNA helicase-2/ATP-dependent DNA helicase PcrA